MHSPVIGFFPYSTQEQKVLLVIPSNTHCSEPGQLLILMSHSSGISVADVVPDECVVFDDGYEDAVDEYEVPVEGYDAAVEGVLPDEPVVSSVVLTVEQY